MMKKKTKLKKQKKRKQKKKNVRELKLKQNKTEAKRRNSIVPVKFVFLEKPKCVNSENTRRTKRTRGQ